VGRVDDVGIACMLMRAGTSKGVFFVGGDLPEDEAERDELLLRLMGTPDPRQIDGLGGAHPLTSKVAVVTPSPLDGVDVDYLFLQLGVEQRIVTDRQTCGNLLAGVGPFALERGIVVRDDPEATVRIRLRNLDAIATATFPLTDGRPDYAGATTLAGVPGASAAITLLFEDVAGGTTGSLLPSGAAVDVVDGIPCTLIDNGMPVVVMRAADLGVAGDERPAELEANAPLREQLERIRHEAARLMGMGDVSESTVPKLTMVSPPRDGGSLTTRTFIPHRCHDAIGVLGAVSVATAAVLPDSPAADVADIDDPSEIVIEHPTGSLATVVDLIPARGGGLPTVRAGIVRTARKLMDGVAFPRDYA
jgi:4-oxalomesaconate tautomerase